MDLNKLSQELARYEKAKAAVDRAGADLRTLDGVSAALDKAGVFGAGVQGTLAATGAVRNAERTVMRGVSDAVVGMAGASRTMPDLVTSSRLSSIVATCSKIDFGIAKLCTKPLTDTLGNSVIPSVADLMMEHDRKLKASVEIPALGVFDRRWPSLTERSPISAVYRGSRPTCKPPRSRPGRSPPCQR